MEKQYPVYNKYKKNLRVERKSSLNNIDSVVVLGLKPSIITLPDCFVNLHLPWNPKIWHTVIKHLTTTKTNGLSQIQQQICFILQNQANGYS